MTTDKMRAEFEALCDSKNYSTEKDAFGNYWLPEIDDFWVMFQLGYSAGRKVEREAIVQTIRTVRGPLAWQSKISFAALAELIEHKSENEQ